MVVVMLILVPQTSHILAAPPRVPRYKKLFEKYADGGWQCGCVLMPLADESSPLGKAIHKAMYARLLACAATGSLEYQPLRKIRHAFTTALNMAHVPTLVGIKQEGGRSAWPG